MSVGDSDSGRGGSNLSHFFFLKEGSVLPPQDPLTGEWRWSSFIYDDAQLQEL